MEPNAKRGQRRQLFGLQVGLRQLLLAMLCVGVWFAHWTNQDGIARLEPKLANLQSLSPELIVSDPNKNAVVKLPSPWYSIRLWEVYIPTDRVRICLSTDDIAPFGLPDIYESVLLPKGQYTIQLDEKNETGGFRFLVTQNGQSCLNIEKKWVAAFGGSSMDSDVWSQTKQFDDNVPIVLCRRRNNVPVPGSPGSSRSPSGPAEGLMLWLQNDH